MNRPELDTPSAEEIFGGKQPNLERAGFQGDNAPERSGKALPEDPEVGKTPDGEPVYYNKKVGYYQLLNADTYKGKKRAVLQLGEFTLDPDAVPEEISWEKQLENRDCPQCGQPWGYCMHTRSR